jgi:hypothetical protein
MPFTPNVTFDIYRGGNSPPAAPDVAQVQGYLAPKGQSTLTSQAYTHELLVEATADLRDDYLTGNFVSPGTGGDHLYMPDQNGTKFFVILVRRVGRGTAADHKQVLVKRASVNWPNDDV